MPTIEERVAFIEGQMSEQSHALIELRDAVRSLNQELREAVRHLDQKVDARFENLGDRISRQFVWLVGVQVTTLLAIVGALLARS
jgi:uncharacterized coiled-coil protein SlyX